MYTYLCIYIYIHGVEETHRKYIYIYMGELVIIFQRSHHNCIGSSIPEVLQKHTEICGTQVSVSVSVYVNTHLCTLHIMWLCPVELVLYISRKICILHGGAKN